MARLESQVDLGHVPTPQAVIDRLVAFLNIPDHCVALDPCCGKGDALVALVPNGKLYGVELEIDRAHAASQHLDHVLACPMQDARIGHDSFGLMLLNPPYDASTEGRLEKVFLERCTRYLRPGGVLVYIIKAKTYGAVLAPLARHYDVVAHWRFPDGYYNGPELAFGQTVLVARRRHEPAIERSPEEFWKRSLKLGDQDTIDAGLEVMPDAFPDRLAVPVGWRPRVFVSGSLSEDDLLKLISSSPLSRKPVLPSRLGCGRPPVTLKQGHIALTLASGMINGVYGDGSTLHVAKGMVVRHINKTQEMDMTAGGRPVLVEKTTDSFTVKVRALTTDGVIHSMADKPEPAPEAKPQPEKPKRRRRRAAKVTIR